MTRVPFSLILLACVLSAGEFPRTLHAWRGSTPKLDGIISRNEYRDATPIRGVRGWTPQFTPTTDDKDLSLRGWVKHDGQRLYFAFEITDDVLYGIDTPRWLPRNNAKAHELTPEGWPWFGDEMEILINARYSWQGDESAAGSGTSFQMVCNLTKSSLGGVGKGGLMEGEPRRKLEAWDTYRKWIESRAQRCVARPDQRSYVIEWSVAFDPCVEVEPGLFWSPALGERKVGLNTALGDLDDMSKGEGNFGNFHHEDWWAGEKDKRMQLRQFGTLVLHPGPRVN